MYGESEEPWNLFGKINEMIKFTKISDSVYVLLNFPIKRKYSFAELQNSYRLSASPGGDKCHVLFEKKPNALM